MPLFLGCSLRTSDMLFTGVPPRGSWVTGKTGGPGGRDGKPSCSSSRDVIPRIKWIRTWWYCVFHHPVYAGTCSVICMSKWWGNGRTCPEQRMAVGCIAEFLVKIEGSHDWKYYRKLCDRSEKCVACVTQLIKGAWEWGETDLQMIHLGRIVKWRTQYLTTIVNNTCEIPNSRL